MTLGPWVVDVAEIELLEAGTTIDPISLPNDDWELEVLVKPLMKAGGMLITSKTISDEPSDRHACDRTYNQILLIPSSSRRRAF